MSSRDEVEFGWFIPSAGDSRYVGIASERQPTAEYIASIAQEAEKAGYEFVLIPTGGNCLDAWGVGSFIFSGYPHLEEASIAGRAVLPLVKKQLELRKERV